MASSTYPATVRPGASSTGEKCEACFRFAECLIDTGETNYTYPPRGVQLRSFLDRMMMY